MSKKKKAAIGLIIAGTILGSCVYSMAASGDPGSEADPLVSKSYVDSRINEALSGSSSADIDVDVDEIVRQVLSKVNAESGSSFATVKAKEGNILVAHEGTEIILRSGIAKAYITGENGISDVTSGKDIFNGEKLIQNHLLIVPRADGRGFVAETECWLLIKGGYDFLN